MKNDTARMIEIEKVGTSRLDQIDFNNLAFGSVFTDHMLVCDFINGQWQNPKIVPYQDIPMSPAARVFHYGQAIFEGMKAYKDDHDDIWLFRPEENFIRFNTSSKRLAIPEIPRDFFFEGLKQLVTLEKGWIQKGVGNSLYLRPFVIATEASVSASPSAEYKFLVICSPAKAYYSGEVRVKIAEKYSRAADGGVGYAKAAGNYAAQFYPTNLAKDDGYQQVIWTDASAHEYLEEAGTMNVFFRINDTLLTAPNNDRILDGVTRKSLIQLAKDNDIDIEIRNIHIKEILEAAESGTLKEIFGSGTAAVISPISGFGYRDKRYELPSLENSYATRFKKMLTDIQYNKAPDLHGWRYKLS